MIKLLHTMLARGAMLGSYRPYNLITNNNKKSDKLIGSQPEVIKNKIQKID